MRAVSLAALVGAMLAGCEGAGEPSGTIERCLARTATLTIDGEPLSLSLEPSRTPGSCERGDPEADAVVQLTPVPGAGELLVRAVPDDPGEDLILVEQRVCGDPSSTTACADHAPGPSGAEQLVVAERFGGTIFLRVRTRSGRSVRVTLSAIERPVRSDGESCDPASAAPGCLTDPECVVADRCSIGRTCSDGSCVAEISLEGGRCGGAIACASALACIDERCADAVGAPCDAPPSYCSTRMGLVCVDEICRRSTAREGERCNVAGPPVCESLLTCEGEPGAEVCVDALGIVCVETATLVAARRPGLAPVVTAVSIDPSDPSMHSSGCGIGAGLPDRSFRVSSVTGVLHAIARSTDGGPAPFLYTRGPSSCAESTHTCADRGDHVSELGAGFDVFLVVDGAGSHELEVYDAEQLFLGAACDDTDPYRVCQSGTECVDGSCASEVRLVPGSCFCRPGGFVAAGEPMRARGGLAPGGEAWFGLLGGATLSVTPRAGLCPADLELDLFDGDVPCGECEPAVLTSVASAEVGDGVACAPVELVIAPGSTRSPRMRLRSAVGGVYDLDVTLTP